jgi:hypothetical protein
MSLKDLFKNKSHKILSNSSIQDLGEEVESEDYVYSYVEEKDRFVPHVDYSKPENFAKFGLAEKYYQNSIERIYNTYPFDGSSKEKINWHNSSSHLDNYIFENEYPRTNGYINLNVLGWGSGSFSESFYNQFVIFHFWKYYGPYTVLPGEELSVFVDWISGGPNLYAKSGSNPNLFDYDYYSLSGSGYDNFFTITSSGDFYIGVYGTDPNSYYNLFISDPKKNTSSYGFGLIPTASLIEYIQIKGGPNSGPNNTRIGANVVNLTKNQTSNLRVGGDYGNSIEFWLNRSNIDTQNTEKEVIFDLWNGESSSSLSYGRFTLFLDSNVTSSQSSFKIHYISGSSIIEQQEIGNFYFNSSSIFNNQWNHFAFSFKNNGTNFSIKSYLNGEYKYEDVISGVNINEITGALIANIGALRTDLYPTSSIAYNVGAGKLSASIDEFRWWKKYRNDKKIGRFWFSQVAGGTNTDTDANQELGVYFKFNEGITNILNVDKSTKSTPSTFNIIFR